MKSWLYGLYAFLIAIVSVFTGELVTFIMLGFILITLQNIHTVLRKMLKLQKSKLD